MGPQKSHAITEEFQDYDGVRTRQLVCDGSGPVIVLLHGVFDRADTWRDVLAELAASGRRAVAVCIPPIHPRRVGEPILPRLDCFVAAVVRAHADGAGVILAGNSMGAGLAVRAASDPDLPVRAAVALDVPGFGYQRLIRYSVGPMAPSEALLSVLRVPRVVFMVPFVARLGARFLYYRGRRTEIDDARYFLDLFAAAPRVGVLAAAGRALLREFDAGYPPGNTAPLLFVHGRDDRLIPVGASIRAGVRYPSAQVRILENSGHCPQLDEPAVVATVITEFGDAVQSSSPGVAR